MMNAMKELFEPLRAIGISIGTEFLDTLYPRSLYCICCGKIIDDSRPYRLCNDCMDGMKWAVGRTCRKCGKPLSGTNSLDICYNCRAKEHRFDRGYTCSEYGEHGRAVVFAMKYDDRVDIAGTIAEMMHDRLGQIRMEEGLPDYDFLLPVPMYPPKQRKRGFNQAELITAKLSGLEGIPYDPGAVKRVRDTRAMRGLEPEERKKNIHGAFQVVESRIRDGSIAGAEILAVDDIYTTGATADALAGVLKEAGAARVDFLSFAAGADMIKS